MQKFDDGTDPSGRCKASVSTFRGGPLCPVHRLAHTRNALRGLLLIMHLRRKELPRPNVCKEYLRAQRQLRFRGHPIFHKTEQPRQPQGDQFHSSCNWSGLDIDPSYCGITKASEYAEVDNAPRSKRLLDIAIHPTGLLPDFLTSCLRHTYQATSSTALLIYALLKLAARVNVGFQRTAESHIKNTKTKQDPANRFGLCELPHPCTHPCTHPVTRQLHRRSNPVP